MKISKLPITELLCLFSAFFFLGTLGGCSFQAGKEDGNLKIIGKDKEKKEKGAKKSLKAVDDEPVERMMGMISRYKREIQYLTGESPVPEREIRRRLRHMDSLLANLKSISPYNKKINQKLARHIPQARKKLTQMRNSPWNKDTVSQRFHELERVCADCHKNLHPQIESTYDPMAGLSPKMRRRLAKPAKESCATCHQDVYKEWKKTYHAKAFSDPIYRNAAMLKSGHLKKSCVPCHTPQPVFFEKISVSYSHRPEIRSVNQNDGVNCKTCHLLPNGKVAARHTRNAPCNPVKTPELTTVRFCGSCHNPTHNAHYEWEESKAMKKGQSCTDCHSQKIHRTRSNGKKRSGFRHDWLGALNKEFVKKGIDVTSSLDASQNKLVVSLQNKAGHKFPGEVPTRVINIEVKGHNGEGERTYLKEISIRRPLKSESGRKDNRLRPDEKRSFSLKISPKVTILTVKVYFQPSPFTLEPDWYLLHSSKFKVR